MIKNIIFDLGGVILNLDQERTIRAFKKLGADLDEMNANSAVFKDFETGKVSADDFIHYIKSEMKGNIETHQIITAWNAMLLDLPKQRVELINSLKSNYRILLFSNTNTIHMDEIYRYTAEHLGKGIFTSLFDKIYLSYEMGLRKPNPDSFHALMQDAGLKGFETVFIDDSKINIKGAQEAGLHTIWAKEPFDNWAIKEIQSIKNLQMN
jgi:putative hydrolase of the HAD superfamily